MCNIFFIEVITILRNKFIRYTKFISFFFCIICLWCQNESTFADVQRFYLSSCINNCYITIRRRNIIIRNDSLRRFYFFLHIKGASKFYCIIRLICNFYRRRRWCFRCTRCSFRRSTWCCSRISYYRLCCCRWCRLLCICCRCRWLYLLIDCLLFCYNPHFTNCLFLFSFVFNSRSNRSLSGLFRFNKSRFIYWHHRALWRWKRNFRLCRFLFRFQSKSLSGL